MSGSMAMYHAATPAEPLNTGERTGAALAGATLATRAKYSEPQIAATAQGQMTSFDPAYHHDINAPPVKYTVPTAQKDRMVAREAIRRAALKGGANRPDPITDEEVDYLQTMMNQTELAKFDRYVASFIDPKKPGQMRLLMELYPEFAQRRMQQVATDYEFALRKQMIDTWGIQSFDDLHFMYLCDQGYLKGPKMSYNFSSDGYTSGILSPYKWLHKRASGVRLPYASSNFGKRAAGENDWTQLDTGQPLGTGANYDGIASEMYQAAGNTQMSMSVADRFNNTAGSLYWNTPAAAGPSAMATGP